MINYTYSLFFWLVPRIFLNKIFYAVKISITSFNFSSYIPKIMMRTEALTFAWQQLQNWKSKILELPFKLFYYFFCKIISNLQKIYKNNTCTSYTLFLKSPSLTYCYICFIPFSSLCVCLRACTYIHASITIHIPPYTYIHTWICGHKVYFFWVVWK